jgi:23S rRNA pseudouridine1911/1915/1917 synthase
MPDIIIGNESGGIRLDRFLASQMTLSRAQIQKLIKSGKILLNNKPSKPNTALKDTDTITLPDEETKQEKVATPVLDVVYEDDDVLVINKPAGLLVHEARKNENRPTVASALINAYPSIAKVGETSDRPGIVHRLDKGVSGLMVAAKTQQAFENLKSQFQNRTVTKEYLALVYGNVNKDHGVVALNIVRSKTKGKMVARSERTEGKEATTEYDVIERLPTTTLLKIKILTGRTHQIRVHMKAIGHSVVGDELHSVRRMKYKKIDLNRLFLHSHRLTIHLMDGKEKTFVSPLPQELREILNKLKKI